MSPAATGPTAATWSTPALSAGLEGAQSNITYYKHDLKDEYDYSHISFYKVGNDTKVANDNMDGIDTGLSLNGLLSDVPSYNNQKEYRNGFGAKNLLNQDDLLVRTTINLNEIRSDS